MKKGILLTLITLILIIMVGCMKEELDITKNNEIPNELEEVEVIEVPDDKNRTTTVKREDLGEFTSIKEMERVNVSAKNEEIKITISDYTLDMLKLKDEYKDYFRDSQIADLNEISLLDINFKIENLSNDILELDSLEGKLKISTGEEVLVFLDVFEGEDESKFRFSGKEVKNGVVSAVLNSKAKEIENFKFKYDDSIIIEVDLK